MPESVGGLALFIVLLAPGFVYVQRRERLTPRAAPSAFRETAEVALASVVGGLVALAGLAAVRAMLPDLTPDVGRFVREGGEYVKDDYRLVAVWVVALVAFACLCTFWAAGPKKPLTRLLARVRKSNMDVLTGSVISPASRWWEMFREEVRSDEYVWLQCTLEDGTYLAGNLGSFSAETGEIADRELVLVGPVEYRGPGDDDITTLGEVSVIVSARRVLYIAVAYMKAHDDGHSTSQAQQKPE